MNTPVINTEMSDNPYRPVPGMTRDGVVMNEKFRISSDTIRRLRLEYEMQRMKSMPRIRIPSIPSGPSRSDDSFFLPLIQMDFHWLCY
jgi:hypothetical protein